LTEVGWKENEEMFEVGGENTGWVRKEGEKAGGKTKESIACRVLRNHVEESSSGECQ
jgi:hypothetical protein